MKLLCWLLLLTSPLKVFAEVAPNCPRKVERRGSIQLQQTLSGDKTNCYITIQNFKITNQIYREYLFASDGELMVFNAFGFGPESEFTGTREFYMFPRLNKDLSFTWNDDARRLEVIDANGSTYYFDYENAQATWMSKGLITVATEVTDKNKGGVEIKKFKGVLLDLGFSKGNAPSEIPSGTAVFKDEAGHSCRFKNSTILRYYGSGDVTFKFTDKELEAFLKRNCPQIVFPKGSQGPQLNVPLFTDKD